MSFRTDGEQEELNKKIKKITKIITTEPKFFGKKDKKKTIELKIDGDTGARRLVTEINKKGERVTKTYIGKTLTRTENIYTWEERRKVKKALKEFLRKKRFSTLKVSLIGENKIVIAHEDEKILDEEI